MADNWDSAYPDFQVPAAPAPSQQAPAAPPQSAAGDAWDKNYPDFAPVAQKPEQSAAASSMVFDPVSGVAYNENDPSGPMRMAGGYAAAAGQYALAGPQLLAHAAKLVSPTYGGAAADAVDKAVDWLGKPGTDEYNIGKTAGAYTVPAMAWPLAADALAAPATSAAVSGSMAGGAPFTGSLSIPGGILSSLGNLGSKAAASGLLSLFSRPVENADQGYWGPKALQTGVDTGLASTGPLIDEAGKLVGPLASSRAGKLIGHVLEKAGPVASAGGFLKLLEDPAEALELAKTAIHNPVVAALGGGGLLGYLLHTQAGQRYGAPIAGTAVQQMLPGILSGAGLQ